jgi:hypothetical protein
MKSPHERLHAAIHKQVNAWATEFDMDVYSVVGVLCVCLLQIWYLHDLDDTDEDDEEDDYA